LLRLKQEREERSKFEKEKAEIERRRRLTDEERTKENMLLGSDATEDRSKTKYRFMQKYYHKGAFFNDQDDAILKRDYNTAVGEDLFDRSNLPKILWKRRGEFGKKGQSKYTHLTDQDTTDFNPEWKVDEGLREKMYGKMAGLKGRDVMERKDIRKMKM
jgi:microfibrillar-associated protein 1